MHCSHLFKVGSKIQACQESVSDPSDLIHSLKVGVYIYLIYYYVKVKLIFQKIPVLMICDDPCTYVSHSLNRSVQQGFIPCLVRCVVCKPDLGGFRGSEAGHFG